MTQLTQLNPEQHKNLNVAPDSVAILAKQMQIVHVNAEEVSKAATELPVFFTRSEQTGGWGMSVLTCLVNEHNGLVQNGRWQAGYTPTYLTTYPIFPMRIEGSEQHGFGINIEDPTLSESEGNALYNEDGSETAYLQNAKRQIESDIKGSMQTHQMTQVLRQLELFKAVTLTLHFSDGSKQNLQGLHTIDEDKLKSLDAATLKQLSDKGYLMVTHACLMSLFKINLLVRSHNQIAPEQMIDKVNIALPAQ